MRFNRLDFKSQKLWIRALLVSGVIIYFIFGAYKLEKFVTVDEHYWINERIIQYWQAIHHQDWEKTYINDKPGITLAYVSGFGLFWEQHPDLYIEKLEKHISLYDPADTARLNLIFRLPLLIFNGLFILILFWLAKKVTGNGWIAAFTATFILLSPVLLGISRIVNPDSLLWNLSFAGMLSFFLYLKSEQKKFAWLTSFFLGLLLATKYTSVILFPFFFLLIILFFIFNHGEPDPENKTAGRFMKFLLAYVLICAGAFALFSVLMPSSILTGKNYFNVESVAGIYSRLWQIFMLIAGFILIAVSDRFFLKSFLFENSLRILAKTRRVFEVAVYALLSSTVIFVIINWMTGQRLINFDNVPFDIKKGADFVNLPLYQKFIIELYPIVFSLSPIILGLLLFVWIRAILKKNDRGLLVFSLSSFVIIYFASLIANDLLGTIRYSIMVYPVLMMLAAIGLWDLYMAFKDKGVRLAYLAAIVVASGVFSLWQIKPFYFDYANSLLPDQYLITSSWGEGGYEAAQYLNSLPNAENLTVWSDYSGVCEFFKGRCIKVYQMEKTQFKIDYYVLTRRGGINYRPSRPRWRKPGFGFVDAYKYYEKNDPVWSLDIDGRPANFIKIFEKEK